MQAAQTQTQTQTQTQAGTYGRLHDPDMFPMIYEYSTRVADRQASTLRSGSPERGLDRGRPAGEVSQSATKGEKKKKKKERKKERKRKRPGLNSIDWDYLL